MMAKSILRRRTLGFIWLKRQELPAHEAMQRRIGGLKRKKSPVAEATGRNTFLDCYRSRRRHNLLAKIIGLLSQELGFQPLPYMMDFRQYSV